MIIDKNFLKEHAELREELIEELQRYDLIKKNSVYYKSPANSDGMPHGSSLSDNVANYVLKKNDTSSYIDNLRILISDQESQIENVIQKLPKAREKTVIRLRYFDLYDWDDIALFLYGDNRNYSNDTEFYKEKSMKIHGAAMQNIIKIQKKE